VTERPLLARVAGVCGVAGAVMLWIFGLLHPKGASDVGAVEEWMTRVGGSDVWIPVHLALLLASILVLLAAVGIRDSFPEEASATWARLAFTVTIVATSAAVATFLVDGAALKQFADLWVARAGDAGMRPAGELITAVGFILVAGLQISKGIAALLFGAAGLTTRAHPRWIGWLAVATGLLGPIPGSLHYLVGTSTATVNLVYVSEALFGLWVFVMSWRLLERRSVSAED
jgi:hypothetical protein